MKTCTLISALIGAALVTSLCFGLDADGTATAAPGYSYATNGVLEGFTDSTGIRWKLVVDKSNLGGNEIEVAEATFPAGTTVGSHPHRSVEIIYVLSGTYDHEVNGKLYRLTPGMVGIVRPGDRVRHRVPKGTDAKLFILWTPAGEVERILSKRKGVTPDPVPELKN
jgi:quercetin dioxygenase-like cupin family protein